MLPVFNEADNLRGLLERFDHTLTEFKIAYRVIAVDDGSTDNSFQVLHELSQTRDISILRHEVNRGLGIALQTGLLEALRTCSEREVIVTMDSDGTHMPSHIVEMMAAMDDGFDVVIASRFRKGAACIGVPFARMCLSVGASMLFRVMFSTRGVRDFTCGFRAYRASILRLASQKYGSRLFEFEGFHSMVDLLLKLRGIDAKFAEVPLVLRYDWKEGRSKMPVLRTVMRTFQLVVRRRLGL